MSPAGGRALVVGTSRGLGLALVADYLGRGWRVVATTRGQNDVGLRDLACERLSIVTFDADGPPEPLIAAVGEEPLDLLFQSAGVLGEAEAPAGHLAAEAFAAVMLTNALAPLRVIEALGGSVSRGGAVVAMTSILGSVGGNDSGSYDVYRASKAALNTMLRSYAARHPERCVIAMHPGWVRTAMGGSGATLSPQESAHGMAEAIAARTGQPGCVFIDWRGRSIEW